MIPFFGAEGTFRPDRIRPIAARFNLDADAVLENVRLVPWLHIDDPLHPGPTSETPSLGCISQFLNPGSAVATLSPSQ